MKVLCYGAVAAMLVGLISCAGASDSHSRLQARKHSRNADSQPAQPAETDEMVNNLLQWIQNLYSQKNRKARQYFGGKPERPRPFEPATYLPPATGYPAAGNRPSPSYSEGPSSPSSPTNQPSPSPPSFPPATPDQSFNPSQPDQPSDQPNPPTFQPNRPYPPSFKPSQPTLPDYPASQPSVPAYQPSQPTQPQTQPEQPSQPNPPTYRPMTPSFQPAQPDYQPSVPSRPSQPEQVMTTFEQDSSSQNGVSVGSTVQTNYGTMGFNVQGNVGSVTEGTSAMQTPVVVQDEDDDRHPPHIHAISVNCGKEMMTINIEFNKPYNGIIYSQDHFNEPECIYVRENSNQIRYSFTVSLNRCGTKFFSDFENEGQAYLENVLVLQNEPGIQEVWDHIRRVRCLWEGNLTKQLVSSLSVGMLNQITSNFSGDTAMARLDIQSGRGPFAPEANGLIKIGEIMTLVVSVTGDPGFDILVRECVAHDSENRHVVPLTDSNGCVLKPKLFGSFQKTRDTGNTGASIIAFAYFNAFKFPDEMDLIIQCNVELCKTDCDVCTLPGSTEPKRRKRDIIHVGNRTVEPSATISKGLRVVFAEDLPPEPSGFCISPSAALWGACFVLFGSLMSSLIVSFLWQRSRGMMKFT